MSRKLKTDIKSNTREARGVTFSSSQRACLRAYLKATNTTQTEFLNSLIMDFNKVINKHNYMEIATKYQGSYLYRDTEKLETVTFRIDNTEYAKFCNISLCIGNDPTVLLRKLALEKMNLPIHTHTLDRLKEDLLFEDMLPLIEELVAEEGII